jgi:Zn-dependent protease
VGVHPTWFLILFLFIWWTNDSFNNAIIAPDQGFYAAVIAAFLFFGSIVLHELGHAFAARREGIGVGGIDLFFFGGFMRAMRDSETPGEEFRVAAAGPAVTLLLTLIFGGVGYALLGDQLIHAATFDFASGSLVEVVIAFAALANAGLFVLNMVPAFPLDGGRITRAVAWQLSGDRHKATRFAAYLGQGFAVLMMGYGVYVFLGDDDQSGGLWWIVLGWMLGGAARAAVAQSRFADRLDGVTAGDIMDAEPVTIPAGLAVERAYDEYFLRYQGWPWFAVVAARGRLATRSGGRRPLRSGPHRHAAGIADRQRAVAHTWRPDGRRRGGAPAWRRDRRTGVTRLASAPCLTALGSPNSHPKLLCGHARTRRVDHRRRSRRSAGRPGGGARWGDGSDYEQGPPGPVALQCSRRWHQRRAEP